eukprot:2560089-Rhodomonas_salina.3
MPCTSNCQTVQREALPTPKCDEADRAGGLILPRTELENVLFCLLVSLLRWLSRGAGDEHRAQEDDVYHGSDHDIIDHLRRKDRPDHEVASGQANKDNRQRERHGEEEVHNRAVLWGRPEARRNHQDVGA